MEQASPYIAFQGDHVLSRAELQLALSAAAGQDVSSNLPLSSHLGSEGGKGAGSTVCDSDNAIGGGIRVSLENKDLWKQFHGIPNEMIVTKIGRRMFPLVQVSISGLDPALRYAILLEFQLTNNHRWRFLNGEWTAAGSFNMAEPPQPSSVYVHTSSPLTGREWMRQKVTFSRVKLSNKEDNIGKVQLVSLYRYQPCIHIVQLDQQRAQCVPQSSATRLLPPIVASHSFKETQFIAVTAYQNDKITQMKIKHNPFAKAFLGSQDTNIPMRALLSDDVMTTSTTPPTLSANYLPFQTPSLHPSMPPPHLSHQKTDATFPSMVALPSFSMAASTPVYRLNYSSQNWPLQAPFQTWNTTATTAKPEPMYVTSTYTTASQEYSTRTDNPGCSQQSVLCGEQETPRMLEQSSISHQHFHQHQQKQHEHCNPHQLYPPTTCAAANISMPPSEVILKEDGPEVYDMSYQVMGLTEQQVSTKTPSISDQYS